MNSLVLPVWSLLWREVIRFLRQRNRIIGALGTPAVFWFIIGSGVGRSFQLPGVPEGFTYFEYFFPGTLVLIMLFTAIFATISIIEDRREGFLQGVLVAPVPRLAVVLGKVLGGTALATLQAGLFLALAPLAGMRIPWVHLPGLLGLFILLGISLTALGFLIAWPLDSVAGFHALMNLLLMPLWLLSGALFPAATASPWVQWVIALNPLHYGLALLRRLLFAPDAAAAFAGDPSPAVSLAVLVACAVALVGAATLLATHVRGRHS